MNKEMLAAVYHNPDDLRLESRPVPETRPDEALVRVISTGICATDIRILHGAHRLYPPGTVRIPGHEVVGDIVEVGEQLEGFEVGGRVFIAPNMGCGRCRQCISGNNNRCPDYDAIGITMDGSFAEYLRVPARAIQQGNLIPISKEMDPAAAALIEPFACVLRGQEALKMRLGESVLVIGAGPIGVMHILLAKLRGAGLIMVSELIPERASQVEKFGVDRVVNPQIENLADVVAKETVGQGIDVVIVAAPSLAAQASALRVAAPGGRINFFGGLPKDSSNSLLDSNLIHYKELIVTGTTGCSTEDCRRSAAIVSSGQVDLGQVIGARLPLSEALTAFRSAEEGKSLKVVMEP